MSPPASTLDRALQSKGSSSHAIYGMVARVLDQQGIRAGKLIDVGCGGGALWSHVADRFDCYIGVDIEQYPGFPSSGHFVACDLESYQIPLPDISADLVAAIETVEHLENPRAFFRELRRILKPEGWLIVTTPNQLSLLSKLTLLLKNNFNAFQDSSYPAHITALLEIDLRRIATEAGFTALSVKFSQRGRIPGGSFHWPAFLSAALPRSFSDNICLVARRTG